jgi:hypothetical protein
MVEEELSLSGVVVFEEEEIGIRVFLLLDEHPFLMTPFVVVEEDISNNCIQFMPCIEDFQRRR